MSASVAIFWLVLAFLAFIATMATVFAVCVRERRRQEPLAPLPNQATNTAINTGNSVLQHPDVDPATTNIDWERPNTGRLQPNPIDVLSDAQSDNRVAMVIFGGIIVGALLALLVGYVVFFSGLTD